MSDFKPQNLFYPNRPNELLLLEPTMRSKGWILFLRFVFAFLICPGLVYSVPGSVVVAQTEEGAEDLEEAFQKKIDAKSTKDLDRVVKLCESAIKKGLDEGGIEQANQLASAALFEHADQLSQRIFSGGQDPRWRVLRTHSLNRLRKAVKFKPDMGEAYLMIAKLNALPGGDKKEARESVEKAVEMAGDDREQLSTALFYRASLADEDESRLADLNQAIKINPKNIDAVRVRAAYHLQKDDVDSALEDLNSWLESDEKNSKNYLIVAQQLMATGPKFDENLQSEAIRIIDKAIEIDPKDPVPHTMRARINLFGEKIEEAAADANAAVELDDKNYAALILRATIYSEQEDLDNALADVNAALKVQPNRIDGLQMRGIILTQQQKFADAIDDFALLSANDTRNLGYQRQLAMLYNADDRPSEAVKIYNRMLGKNKKGSWEGKSARKQLVGMASRAAGLRGRGDAMLSLGEHAKAVSDYEEALELGEQIQDIEESEGVETVSKPDDGVLNNLAWVLATSPKDDVRDGEKAIEYATMAAEVTEYKEAHILSTLASGYAESGDFDKAIEWIEKAIEVNKKVAKDAVDKTRTDEQFESLNKELESYKKKEPWRELQNVEEEKKAKADDESDEDKKDEKKAKDDESKGDDESDKDNEEDDEDKDDKDADSDDKDDVDKDDVDKDDGDKVKHLPSMKFQTL
jgi:tetratricopeptide (TPR) repeat protein